jgi:hypothetical protein
MKTQLKLPYDANGVTTPKEHKKPPSKTHSLTKDLSERKFLRLVEKTLAGGVVPFLGAGLSLQSPGPNGKTIACTQTMTCAVCNELYKDRPDSKCKLNNKCCSNPNLKCVHKRGLADICEEYQWEGGRQKKLIYDILQIHEFMRLKITNAHRYIAYLARESLIEEVITSNYDTSLERAYTESVGIKSSSNEDLGLHFSVSCLHEYRMISGKKNKEPFPLKVYHVNGCAKDLIRDNHDSLACETILLTERQLQDWGNRQWGRDLLRDRLRCKSIVFSGFGSPEPQVRHTLLQILEEFEMDRDAKSQRKSIEQDTKPQNKNQEQDTQTQNNIKGWEAPNAIFIHAYKDLTFEQRQILSTYAFINNTDTNKESIVESGNCFTQADTPLFLKKQSDGLPADDFWKCIYKAVFLRLLNNNWLNYGSPFYYFLSSSIAFTDVLLGRIRQWLLPESRLHAERLFGRFPELLDINNNSTFLSSYIWHIRHRGLPFTSGWYAPISEKGIIISSFFIIVYILGFLRKKVNEYPSWNYVSRIIKKSQSLGLGLEFDLPGNSVGKGLLLLAHGESLFQPEEQIANESGEQIFDELAGYKIIVQAVININFKPAKIRIRLVKKSTDSTKGVKHVRFINVYQVAFSDLLRKGDSQVNNLDELIKTVRKNLLYPNTILSSFQRGVRNKGHIRRVWDGTSH